MNIEPIALIPMYEVFLGYDLLILWPTVRGVWLDISTNHEPMPITDLNKMFK